jgi:hypothetical protein
MAELSKADLDDLVEEAIVDAYGEDEQLAGFYTMIEENLVLPFMTMVLGVEVTVEDIANPRWSASGTSEVSEVAEVPDWCSAIAHLVKSNKM